MNTRRLSLLPAALLAVTAGSYAQPVPDPTRPPGQLAAPGTVAEASGAPVLQSVIIRGRGPEAVINGQAVKPGDTFGDSKVVRITESEVVLRNGKDLQVLKLFPSLEKRPAQGRAQSRPARRADEK